jgi:hypothetical protein
MGALCSSRSLRDVGALAAITNAVQRSKPREMRGNSEHPFYGYLAIMW